MIALFTLYVLGCAVLLTAGVLEQRRHHRTLFSIPQRVVVNGIRGKSSITRLCAGALRGGGLVTVAKTTGSAARFITPDGEEEPIYRKFGLANIVEQIGIVRRAAAHRPDALVIECMAVLPDLQEVNERKLIRSTVCVISNVREDHLAEMGPTLDDVARSLSRSMPEGGVCITAERDRFAVLQAEADRRRCRLVQVDPESVTDAEMARFPWITFKENVAIALEVARLQGIDRAAAFDGMVAARPDPGTVAVRRHDLGGGRVLDAANIFAANDPASTLMNIELLAGRGLIDHPLTVVINCRPDRVERNGQMGELTGALDPDAIVLIGEQTRSAKVTVPPEFADRVVDLGGPLQFDALLDALAFGPDGRASLVAVGNIHGQGEVLLSRLAALPAARSAVRAGAGSSRSLPARIGIARTAMARTEVARTTRTEVARTARTEASGPAVARRRAAAAAPDRTVPPGSVPAQRAGSSAGPRRDGPHTVPPLTTPPLTTPPLTTPPRSVPAPRVASADGPVRDVPTRSLPGRRATPAEGPRHDAAPRSAPSRHAAASEGPPRESPTRAVPSRRAAAEAPRRDAPARSERSRHSSSTDQPTRATPPRSAPSRHAASAEGPARHGAPPAETGREAPRHSTSPDGPRRGSPARSRPPRHAAAAEQSERDAPSRPGSAPVDPTRPVPPGPVPPRAEPARREPARPETAPPHWESVRSESVRAALAPPEPVPDDRGQADRRPPRGEPTRGRSGREPVGREPAASGREPRRRRAAGADPAHPDPAHPDPAHPDPADAGSAHRRPVRPDAALDAVAPSEPARPAPPRRVPPPRSEAPDPEPFPAPRLPSLPLPAPLDPDRLVAAGSKQPRPRVVHHTPRPRGASRRS